MGLKSVGLCRIAKHPTQSVEVLPLQQSALCGSAVRFLRDDVLKYGHKEEKGCRRSRRIGDPTGRDASPRRPRTVRRTVPTPTAGVLNPHEPPSFRKY